MVKSAAMLILLGVRSASAARIDISKHNEVLLEKEQDQPPTYKCETIPTYASDPLRACASIPGKAACFSLTEGTFWACSSTKHGPNFPEENHCTRQHDPNGDLYAGACLHEGHQKYDSAINWNGVVPSPAPAPPAAPESPGAPPAPPPAPPPSPPPATDDRRRRRAPHPETSRMAPGWIPMGRDGITGISGDAIGWEREPGTSFGTGLWCEAGAPAAGWSPGTTTCPERVGEPLRVKILTYNLFWWNLFGVRGGNGNSAGNLIHSSHEDDAFDFLGFQECDDVHHVLNVARLSGTFTGYSPAQAIGIAWSNEWRELAKGYVDVAEDSHLQWYGVRSAVYARLQHKRTGKIALLVNHHGPLPTHVPGGICGPQATAYNILRLIGERAHKGDAVFLLGDFNAYEDAPTFSELQKYLHLAYKGHAFRGVDEFYTNCGEVLNTENLGTGGSDHAALKVTYGMY